MTKWAVVACDQFTSEPEYWQAVEQTVGDAPSTLRLILPEANLNGPRCGRAHRRHQRRHGQTTWTEGVFQTLPESLVYIERTAVRRQASATASSAWWTWTQYDFTPGSGALIRATEGTVLDRIPPRVRVRQRRPHRAAPCDAADRRPRPDRDRAPDRRHRRDGDAV